MKLVLVSTSDGKSLNQVEEPSSYLSNFSLSERVIRVALIGIFAVGVVVFALHCSNHLISFPQDFIGLFVHANPLYLALGFGITTLLIGGTTWVIYRARKQKDPRIQSEIFSSRYSDQTIQDLLFQDQDGKTFQRAYIDRSTIMSGNGKAYLYGVKDPSDHYLVSISVSLMTPVATIGTIAYHTIRMVIVPFYVLGCWLIERYNDKNLIPGDRRFELIDVIKEPAKSLVHIVKAPFYGLALLVTSLYSLVDPMGGRTLAAKIERDWNDGFSRAEGCWSVRGSQRLWAGCGELGPSKLGRFKFFLAGCWQPIGIVTYNDNQVVQIESLSHAINSEFGELYFKSSSPQDSQ